jgi:zinc transport system permease protein
MDRVFGWVDAVAGALARSLPYGPFQDPHMGFLHRALLGLLLLAPLCSTIGLQVVNYRLAFFSEAVGHSAFTGVALGLLLGVLANAAPLTGQEFLVTAATTGFAVLVAVAITAYRRATTLPSDTILGAFSATVIAAGLCVIYVLMQRGWVRGQSVYQSFLMGSILTINPLQLTMLLGLFVAIVLIEAFAYNRLTFLGINAELAETRGIPVAAYEYLFAVLLALVVMFSIQVVGVLLVTALLVIPAATARNLSRSAAASFWVSLASAVVCSLGGLILSVEWNTPTGATVILCMAGLFLLTSLSARSVGR